MRTSPTAGWTDNDPGPYRKRRAPRRFLHFPSALGVQLSVSYPVPMMKSHMIGWIDDKQHWQPALDQHGSPRSDA